MSHKVSSGYFNKPHQQCPKGYRFFVQDPDAKDQVEFNQWIERTFGFAKACKALIEEGHFRNDKLRPKGFRAYLPISFDSRYDGR